MGFYSGKNVVITGGSSGIGRAVALELASRGANVVITARGEAKLVETVDELRAASPSGTFGYAAFDVVDAEAAKVGIASAIEQLGHLDVLICNSGYAKCGATWEVSSEDFRRLYEVNCLGHVHVVQAAVPHMRERGQGEICLLSSTLGFFSVYGYGAYSASKYAISGLAEALRQELMLDGVNVRLFYPPTTETPGLERENEDKPPLVWAIEDENSFTKTYTAERVAKGVADCIPGGRFENTIGFDWWLISTIYRLAPRFARWMADREMLAAKRKVDAKAA